MIRIAAALTTVIVLAGCDVPPTVVSDTGSVIELIGGPAVSTSVGQSVDYLQPSADEACRAKGFKRAQFAGEKVDAFIYSHLFNCLN